MAPQAGCPAPAERGAEQLSSVALIIYGRGGSLGNFEIFSRDLAGRLATGRAASPSGTFARDRIVQINIERRARFFDYLKDPPFRGRMKIKELHVFSHSIGAGLFLSYGDPAVDQVRVQALRRAALARRNITYREALEAEVGAILVDDFIRPPYLGMKAAIRANFEPGAIIKLWGCNSAITGWIYRDNGTSDPANTLVTYYWRAFNEQNLPKPSIAQSFSDYFGLKTYGASAGSHIEVLHRGSWISSERYRTELGRWPSGALQHRLAPDRGSYDEYAPTPSP